MAQDTRAGGMTAGVGGYDMDARNERRSEWWALFRAVILLILFMAGISWLVMG